MLVQTIRLERYPDKPKAWFAVMPAGPDCDFEGPELAANAGDAIPPEGTVVEAERIRGKLVIVYNG